MAKQTGITTLHKRIGLNIRRIRLKRKLTLEELSFRVGISTSFLSQIENGHKNFSVYSLFKISQHLSCDPKDLI